MKLKATLLTLLLFIGIGLAGCSANSEKTSSSSSDNKVEKQSDTSSTSSDSQSSAVKDDDDNDDQDDNDSNTSATSSNSSSKAKVRYRTVKFQAQLDDVDDSRLYQSVPLSRRTKTASWNSVDAHEGKRVYVDKKAIVLTRDRDDHDDDDDYDDNDNDDNGYDSEEYYRIRFSASNSAKKYWVEEDVVDTDNDD